MSDPAVPAQLRVGETVELSVQVANAAPGADVTFSVLAVQDQGVVASVGAKVVGGAAKARWKVVSGGKPLPLDVTIKATLGKVETLVGITRLVSASGLSTLGWLGETGQVLPVDPVEGLRTAQPGETLALAFDVHDGQGAVISDTLQLTFILEGDSGAGFRELGRSQDQATGVERFERPFTIPKDTKTPTTLRVTVEALRAGQSQPDPALGRRVSPPVRVVTRAPVIVSFVGNEATFKGGGGFSEVGLGPGQALKLGWFVAGRFDAVRIDPGAIDVFSQTSAAAGVGVKSGELALDPARSPPDESGNYTLVASNLGVPSEPRRVSVLAITELVLRFSKPQAGHELTKKDGTTIVDEVRGVAGDLTDPKGRDVLGQVTPDSNGLQVSWKVAGAGAAAGRALQLEIKAEGFQPKDVTASGTAGAFVFDDPSKKNPGRAVLDLHLSAFDQGTSGRKPADALARATVRVRENRPLPELLDFTVLDGGQPVAAKGGVFPVSSWGDLSFRWSVNGSASGNHLDVTLSSAAGSFTQPFKTSGPALNGVTKPTDGGPFEGRVSVKARLLNQPGDPQKGSRELQLEITGAPKVEGPFLWLRKGADDSTLKDGGALAFGKLEDAAPLTPSPLLFDAKEGKLPLAQLAAVAGVQRLSISFNEPSLTDSKGAGITDKGHYLVRAAGADGKPDPASLLIAGELGVGQPDVLRHVPAADTAVTVFKWDDGKRQGQGFQDVKHWFVLMLENRSFDHLLGHNRGLREVDGTVNPDGRRRTDCVNDEFMPDKDNNLVATGKLVHANTGALDPMPVDPGHELMHVHFGLVGWTGAEGTNELGAITMRGFVAAYLNRLVDRSKRQGQWDGDAITTHHFPLIPGQGFPTTDKIAEKLAAIAPAPPFSLVSESVMLGFAPERLPVLNRLARSYAVCDRWFSSLPGPTWPNRLFVHCGTSGGLDDSPDAVLSLWKGAGAGRFDLPTIYDRLTGAGCDWRIFSEAGHPQSATLFPTVPAQVTKSDGGFRKLEAALKAGAYEGFQKGSYTFLEPEYGALGVGLGPQGPLFDVTTAFGGEGKDEATSQHPVSGTKGGENLIKRVYELLRASAIWEQCALIVTYDEHGGFYDHVPPPRAVPPGGTSQFNPDGNHRSGKFADAFKFDVYGVRVPTVVISPLIPEGVVDHTIYDHASVIATLRLRFGLPPLTDRDRKANDFSHLFALKKARSMPGSVDDLTL